MEKIRIPYPIIVEGKYDKIKLSSLVDGSIWTTDGFGIFNRKEKQALFRALAQKSRVILLTDSDGAGKLIRSKITGMIPRERLIQLYIPQIPGKERRKEAPSAEGTLGVEGMEIDLLRQILAPYAEGSESPGQGDGTDGNGGAQFDNPLSKADFFEDGLTGCENSRAKRNELASRLGLPADMTPGALLEAVRLLCSYEDYKSIVSELNMEKKAVD